MTTFEICIAQLQALLELENTALSQMDVGAVAALTEEKNRLVNLLRTFSLNPDRRPDLTDRVTYLSKASEDNKVLLERAMLVQRRLMAIVAAASRPPMTSYGRSGAAAASQAGQARAITARV